MGLIQEKAFHPAINRSYIAEKLYGSRESKNRAKLSEKMAGRKGWKDWELQRLEEIFKELKKEI
jgi:hypothetical protein